MISSLWWCARCIVSNIMYCQHCLDHQRHLFDNCLSCIHILKHCLLCVYHLMMTVQRTLNSGTTQNLKRSWMLQGSQVYDQSHWAASFLDEAWCRMQSHHMPGSGHGNLCDYQCFDFRVCSFVFLTFGSERTSCSRWFWNVAYSYANRFGPFSTGFGPFCFFFATTQVMIECNSILRKNWEHDTDTFTYLCTERMLL